MSPLHWIGEADAPDEELPPLPRVYRLDGSNEWNEPELSAEESSADFSALTRGKSGMPRPPLEDADGVDPFGEDVHHRTGKTADEAAGTRGRGFAPVTEEIPCTGVTLSDIRPTKKGRMALFWQNAEGEEQFLFSVDEETCVLQQLQPGKRLSAAGLEAVRSCSDLRRAKDRALQYIATREHASGELYRKLSEKFDEPTAAAAVAEMHRLGLLDDGAFAERRAAYLAGKGKSRREIGRLLAELGIGREDRETALAQLPEDEEQTLRMLVKKQYAGKLAAGKKDNVAAALLRRGFSGALVRRVLTELTEDADAAWEDA